MTHPYAENLRKDKGLFSIPISSLREFGLFAIFVLSLQPYSIYFQGAGVTASYAFLLLFLIHLRTITITKSALSYLLLFSAIFIAGYPTLLFADSYYQIRTILSFLAFMAPLSLLIVRFKDGDLSLFVYAVVLSSLYASTISILEFMRSDVPSIFHMKDAVGSQGYGFVLCLGFFLVLLEKRMSPFIKVPVLIIILLGSLLTFSRSTIVALGSAFVLLVIMNLGTVIRNRRYKSKKVLRGVLISLVLFAVPVYYFQDGVRDIWQFYDERLVSAFLSGKMAESAATLDPGDSHGYRLYVMSKIFEYVLYHPLTGSSYAGVYLLFDEGVALGSTHSQYSDVLLRTGVLGFGLYVYLVIKVLGYFREEKGVFFGFVAILVYGLFHETFKLGHGAFIFWFLVSYEFWMHKRRLLNVENMRGRRISIGMAQASA